MEETLAILKPDVFGKPWLEALLEKNDEEPPEVDDDDDDAEPPPEPEPWKSSASVRAPDMTTVILDRIAAEGFDVVQRKTLQLTPAVAAQFYAEHTGKPFLPGLIAHMTSGPCLVMVLRKEGAIAAWRRLIGPTDPAKARAQDEAAAPLDDSTWTLRALFGDAGPRNAAHGSDSPFSAMREINIMFPPAAPVYERTFLTLAGAAADDKDADAVRAALEDDDFVVVASAASGGAVGMVVEGFDAVRRLQLRAGPPAVAVAKDTAPSSLRARFAAADGDVAAAASTDAAAEAQAKFFQGPLPLERTLAVIKPGVAVKHGQDVLNLIHNAGFTVLAETRTRLSRAQAEQLLAPQAARPSFFNTCHYLASGPVIALALAKPAAIKSWQALMGPPSSEEAAREAPHTLRGRFGTDAVANAVGGSADPDAANREICFFFPHLHPEPLLQGDAATAYITDNTVAVVQTPMGPVPKTLHSTLVSALTELCKHKPTGVEAVEWLGKWLLANNPRGVPAPDVSGSVDVGASVHGVHGDDDGDAGVEEYKSDGAGSVMSSAAGSASASAPAAAGGQAPRVVFVLGGDASTATLCDRLAKAYGYTHIDASESQDAAPEPAVALVKEAMARADNQQFIVQGFPSTLAQAFLFEQSCAAPAFVLLDGADGPVPEFYAKLGVAHPIASSGDAAFASAMPHFLPKVVFMLGRPHTGRTALCNAVGDRCGYVRLALEDLVRAEAESGSVFGRSIADTIARGDQLPMDAVLRLFKAATAADPLGRYIIDGYPRTVEQANAFTAAIAPPEFVVHLECPEAECVRRGGAAVKKALRVFNGRTQVYLQHAAALGLVRTVDASRPPALVAADVQALFDPEVVFVLGGPGSGKGTQSARLASTFGHVHLSAGDLLRAEVARQSARGQEINDYIIKGQLVPVEVTLALLRTAMTASGATKFLVDGFPRAADQAVAFESTVCSPSRVLYLDVDDAELTARLLERGKTSGRADDNADAIKRRLHTFHTQSEPVLQRYAAQGKVVAVDGSRSVEEVWEDVDAAFRPRVVVMTGGPSCGKAEQCRQVVARFGYTHLHVDGIVEAEIALGTRNGERVEKMVAAGDVPTDEVLALLTTAMARSRGARFLLDGFPRTEAEALALEAGGARPAFCVHLSHPADTVAAPLAAVHAQYRAEDRLVTAMADGGADATFAQVRVPLQPELVVLVGATGSGRGEFCRRAGTALGYARLRVTHLLRAEAASGSVVGKVIARALAARRTVPTDAAVAVIAAAVGKAPTRRFLLDGYPRTVNDGYPSVQDQVFALEQGLGPVRGVVVLDAADDTRQARVGAALTPGQQRELDESVEVFRREKLAVLRFFEKTGKVMRLDTTQSPDDVFTAASSFLE